MKFIDKPDWALATLEPDSLKEKILADFDWSMRIDCGLGAYVWKSVSRTGLLRLEIRSLNEGYRDEIMDMFGDLALELSNGRIVDTFIRYPDDGQFVGWVLFHPEVEQ